jgi:hypothetical protein
LIFVRFSPWVKSVFTSAWKTNDDELRKNIGKHDKFNEKSDGVPVVVCQLQNVVYEDSSESDLFGED